MLGLDLQGNLSGDLMFRFCYDAPVQWCVHFAVTVVVIVGLADSLGMAVEVQNQAYWGQMARTKAWVMVASPSHGKVPCRLSDGHLHQSFVRGRHVPLLNSPRKETLLASHELPARFTSAGWLQCFQCDITSSKRPPPQSDVSFAPPSWT